MNTIRMMLVSSALCMAFSCSQIAYAANTAKQKKLSLKRINVKKTGKNSMQWSITSKTVFAPIEQYDQVCITKHTRAGRGLLVPRNRAYIISIGHAGPAVNGDFTITELEAPELKSLSIDDDGNIQEIRTLREKKPEKPASDAKPSDKPEEKKPDVKDEKKE